MSLVVVNYPVVTREDLCRIQAIRAEHDELYYEVADPHFTLVFPSSAWTTSVSWNTWRSGPEASRGYPSCAGAPRWSRTPPTSTPTSSWCPTRATAASSSSTTGSTRVYEGLLAPHLRLDILFIPHIGVANSLDPKACKDLADKLNREGFEIGGFVDAFDVASYEHDRVKTVERLPLEGRGIGASTFSP